MREVLIRYNTILKTIFSKKSSLCLNVLVYMKFGIEVASGPKYHWDSYEIDF